LPEGLRPLVEFYDPDRLCSAASLQDNLLFGRLAQDRAGAESVVYPVIRRVLRDRGLDPEVFRNGLATPVDPDGAGLSAREVAAVDLVRCLVRRPDVLVVEQAEALADGRTGPFVARLRQALEGRGLVIGFGETAPALDDVFDVVMRFERGALAGVDDRRAQAAATEPAPA
jgi:ABC-type multidrug transport system fused ATPase/permease subunit